MSVEIPTEFAALLEAAEYVWFSTVRADGMPQPTPVWFIREGDTYLIYTIPDSQKVTNLKANPKVALSWSNDDAETYVVVMGEVSIDKSAPPANQNAPFLAKYREGIAEIGMTPDSYVETFSLPLRVTPLHVRGNVE